MRRNPKRRSIKKGAGNPSLHISLEVPLELREKPTISNEAKIHALHYAKFVLLAFFAMTILASITLAVYVASGKAIGEASSLISSTAGAVVAALAVYYFGRGQKHRIENQVGQLRAQEKELYQRLDKEIKSLVAKAP